MLASPVVLRTTRRWHYMTGQHRADLAGSASAVDLINRIRGRAAPQLPTFRGDLPIPRPRDVATSAGAPGPARYRISAVEEV